MKKEKRRNEILEEKCKLDSEVYLNSTIFVLLLKQMRRRKDRWKIWFGEGALRENVRGEGVVV